MSGRDFRFTHFTYFPTTYTLKITPPWFTNSYIIIFSVSQTAPPHRFSPPQSAPPRQASKFGCVAARLHPRTNGVIDEFRSVIVKNRADMEKSKKKKEEFEIRMNDLEA
ncbi:hypothetical protein L2E82_05074 [Cichorium intybus]|uniref:Uncharacterized protein n=1 Tax=Cichorium intybus TaxID=13427 RepID=A0ACB9H7B2_CICIN|nr:hypothetical protein L2E82_05074 [Cichorium intybus]